MSIRSSHDLEGITHVSYVVATTLRKMKEFARPGMSTREIDEFGAGILQEFGARSAPRLTYNFPGWTCISVNHAIAHGIPTHDQILEEGDLVNIDVSAELEGFWSDNGSSFVLGHDKMGHQQLVDASRDILMSTLAKIRPDVRINRIGRHIESSAKKLGYTVIRNLAGHGVGGSLHETPHEILNCYDAFNRQRFKENSVVAIETFISTRSNQAITSDDGWTLFGNRGGYTAQHEHAILITDGEPIILTSENGVF